jgi:hypothetical protein
MMVSTLEKTEKTPKSVGTCFRFFIIQKDLFEKILFLELFDWNLPINSL